MNDRADAYEAFAGARDVPELYLLVVAEVERRMEVTAWTKKSGRQMARVLLPTYSGLMAEDWDKEDEPPDERKRFKRTHGWVRKASAEASRNVGRRISDPDHVVSVISTHMEAMIREGFQSKDPKKWSAAVQAARLWADLAGVLKATKHEVTGAGGAPLGLPPQIAALWDRATAGEPDAVAIVERYARTGEVGPGLDPGESECSGGAGGP